MNFCQFLLFKVESAFGVDRYCILKKSFVYTPGNSFHLTSSTLFNYYLVYLMRFL